MRQPRGATMPVACCFDIETTGLCKIKSQITVICMTLYDTDRKRSIQKHVFNVCLAREESRDKEADLKLSVRTILNGSDVLVAYNGKSFDLPFLAAWINDADHDMVESWQSKTIDFLHEAKERIDSYIGMNQVAQENEIQLSKIATGKQAIIWAEERNWGKLEEYCSADVDVLLAIFQKAQDIGIVMRAKKKAFDVKDRKSIVLTVTSALVVVSNLDQVAPQTALEPNTVNPSQTDIDDIFG